MTIYVDDVKVWPTGQWCHMMTDSPDLEELHKEAAALGLQRRWFQDKAGHPHYDLRPTKRRLAIERGAVIVETIEMVRMWAKLYPRTGQGEPV